MNANPPDDGAGPPPQAPPPPPPPPPNGSRVPDRGGSMLLALTLGLLGLYIFGIALVGGRAVMPYQYTGSPVPLWLSLGFWVPLVVYVALAVFLATRRRTSLTGAGMLIAFGVWVLLGGELCITAMFRMPSAA
ncbi:hypothetical protein [Sinomonas sp. P10A9]|uniref:Uncharacterized protein n=1 Tax=Sinomonas puerhi TaxID=3238584 RepID=A0AB39L2Z4_9MICC